MTKQPLRILELRSVWGTGGGPEKTILLGAARSDPGKYLVTVCYIRDKRDTVFGPKARIDGMDIDYVEVYERHSLDPFIWPRLRQVVRDRHIDIVHSHDYKTDLFALLLSWAEGIIPLSTAHGWTGNSTREQVYYFANKKLLRKFPLVIAVSSEIRRELVRHGVLPDQVKVVLNGINPAAFRRDHGRDAEARQKLGLPADRTVIGAVGRLEMQKRFDILIEAFAELRRRHPQIILAIAGDGSLRSELEGKIKALSLNGDCRLLGHQKDVPLVHHALDIFAQSSEYEGTPNSVLEAMALESPIVATDVGGTAELVRHGVDGLIVPPNNPQALRDALVSMLQDRPAVAARVASARARIENELSFELRMHKVEAFYEMLAKQRPQNRKISLAADVS
jgi:glycosyltransferase involved in cell wall biosynthesis